VTYYGSNELAAGLRTVKRNTFQIAQDVPDEKYGSAPPHCRTDAACCARCAKRSSI
jgi:hypothetical protein